jgi:ribosome-associated translation inhibitor RaiA
MKPTIIAKSIKLNSLTQEHVVRRLRFAFDQARHRIQFITVRLFDLNGPRGGIDKCCQVHLTLPGLPDVIATGKAQDIVAAVNQAVHRAARAVNRMLARTKAVPHANFVVSAS